MLAATSDDPPRARRADWFCYERRWQGVGAVAIPCWRDTDGLAVPGSEARGPCAGEGAVGTREVRYEVCRGGQPAPATRVEPCRR